MNKNNLRKKRSKRGRAKIFGTTKRPRLCVFLSSRYVYAQLIDDEKGAVIAAADSRKMSGKGKAISANTETAKKVGSEIAKIAVAKKIKEVVFDRCGYKYHGKVKALAEGAKEGGLVF